LLRHPNNPWQKELQALLARAEAGEDISIEAIDLLSRNDNVSSWVRDQIDSDITVPFRGYQLPPGAHGRINASYSWLCQITSCTESLPVIQVGEDPPMCEVHRIVMIRGKN